MRVGLSHCALHHAPLANASASLLHGKDMQRVQVLHPVQAQTSGIMKEKQGLWNE